jgi:hypothetical protein
MRILLRFIDISVDAALALFLFVVITLPSQAIRIFKLTPMVRCPQKLEGTKAWSMNHFSRHNKPLKTTALFAGHVDQQVSPHQDKLYNKIIKV